MVTAIIDGPGIKEKYNIECTEKIVIVNGPEIQQPNHDGVDKKQQPGQDFIGVGKSDQTAKRVNMKLGILLSIKKSLLLILVNFPVADCNQPDFKWLPTNTIVKGVFHIDVQLMWKYQSNFMLDKIDISRKKTEYEKEHVALWTPDEGSKPSPLISTDVTLEHRKEGDVDLVILTLMEPYPVDFDKHYYCAVSFENGLDFMEIELQSYRVEYQPVADVVKARPGDDVQFVWIYKYQLPLTFVDFDTDNDFQNDILTWSRSDGVYDIEDEYKNRVDVNITTNNGQEEVTLTLHNVTRDDFDLTYSSSAMAANGYYKTSKITLKRLPVEEEKAKPVKKTISTIKKTISAPSSASCLSKASFLFILVVVIIEIRDMGTEILGFYTIRPATKVRHSVNEVEAEMESLDEQECKEKIVIVNGPEIQQQNHDVIDKKQQPYQDFIGVRKLRLTAKGVKIKRETLFSFLKYSLLLILVCFPVARCNHRDFKWLPTDTIVKGFSHPNVQLVWKYQSNLTLDKIDVNRKKTKYEKEDVALWTPDEGSKPNTLLSTDVTLEHRKEGDVGTIILTLIKPFPVDFDKRYYCTVSFENGLEFMEIERQPYNFKWLPTNTTVKGVYQTDVQLVWKYQYILMLDKIDISRKKTEYGKEHVALWTPDQGSKPYTLLSTDVTLEHRKEGDVGTIILTLVDPYPVDFDKQYYCTVYFDHGVDSMEIELQSYKVEYQPVADVVKARPGDDVQFVWIYKYQLPVTYVDFYKNQNEILRWSRYDGNYDIEVKYTNRLVVNLTTNKDQEEVTLTLRNVTRGDFDHKYKSLAIAADGYFKSSKITLIPLPVDEEKPKPVEKTISLIKETETPSSASRLSQVSMFLICSVLLLAV